MIAAHQTSDSMRHSRSVAANRLGRRYLEVVHGAVEIKCSFIYREGGKKFATILNFLKSGRVFKICACSWI